MIRFGDTHIVIDLSVAAALLAFAGKDETRPSIGVGIDQGSVCATDGHRALAFEPCPDALWCARWQGRRWSRTHLEQQVKIAKATKAKELSLWEGHASEPKTFAPIWRVMPDYGVEPKRDESIGVDPEYLADLGKVAKACGVKGVQLTSIRHPLDPIGFKAIGAHTASVAIMPMRK